MIFAVVLAATVNCAAQATGDASTASPSDAALRVEKLSAPREVEERKCWVSSDGTRWAYAAGRGSRIVMVVDGHEVGPYSGLAATPFRIPGEENLKDYQKRPGGAFTPDGELFVFTAQKGDKVHVVTVGKDGVREGPGLAKDQSIFEVIMPPAGHRFAVFHRTPVRDHYGRTEQGMRLIIDDRNSPDFNFIDKESIIYSPDGRHISYIGRQAIRKTKPGSRNVGYYMVIDHTSGPKFGSIYYSNSTIRLNQMLITDDGPKALYFVESQDNGGKVVLQSPDGSVEQLPITANPKSVVMTEDSKHWACVRMTSSKKSKNYKVYLDGELIASYDGELIKNLTISPDGKRSAFTGVSGNLVQPVIDGKVGLDYAEADHYTFSPDGKRLAFVVKTRNDRKPFLVLDGKEYGPYKNVGHIVFSPDSRQAAWAAKVNDYNMRAFLEGQSGPDIRNPGISWVGFSPADGQLVYMAGSVDSSGRDDSRVVYLGLAGEKSFPAASNPQVIDGGKHLAFVGRNPKKGGRNQPEATEAPFFVCEGKKVPMLDTVVEPSVTFGQSGHFVVSAGHSNFIHERKQGLSINGALVIPLANAAGAPKIADGRAELFGITKDGQLVRVSADMQQFVKVKSASQVTETATGMQVVHKFTGGEDGANPLAPLVMKPDTLYGIASGGKSQSWRNLRLDPRRVRLSRAAHLRRRAESSGQPNIARRRAGQLALRRMQDAPHGRLSRRPRCPFPYQKRRQRIQDDSDGEWRAAPPERPRSLLRR